VNVPLSNHLFSNHHSRPISITVHPHLIHTHYYLPHFLLILSMDHQAIHHLIIYPQPTTVMVSLVHHETITMNNNIKIFFMIDFYFIWLLLVDNSIYHSMVILNHPMVYGVQHFVLLLVSTKFFFLSFFFTTCKIHCNLILSILVTRLVRSNYNRFILIALTFLLSHSLPHIPSIKSQNVHKHTHTYEYN
jgi:hypothetical protein